VQDKDDGDGDADTVHPRPQYTFTPQSILAENEKRSMYYIEWEGVDPETGEPWQPTWVSRAEPSFRLHRIRFGRSSLLPP
jgi:hypothetical protein